MRKLESVDVVEKRRKRNVMAMSLFMLVVMLSGTVGFAFLYSPGSQGSIVDSGGGEGVDPYQGRARVLVNGESLVLNSELVDVDAIPVVLNTSQSAFRGGSVYVVANDSRVLQVLGGVLGRVAGRVQEACFGECEQNIPERGCEDTGAPLVVFSESDSGRVFQEDNCVFIEGDLVAAEAFVIELFKPPVPVPILE